MFPQTTGLTLNPAQLAAATSAMLRIAHIDGACTTEEVALIRVFYGNGDGGPSFDSLLDGFAARPVGSAEFTDTNARELVLATCIMVALADGEISTPELTALHSLAEDLGVDAPHFEHLLALVKDHMLARLATLPDAASVAAVARELG